MNKLIEVIERTTGLSPGLQAKLLASVAIILILWLLCRLIMRMVWQQTEDVRTRYIWRKTLTYITIALGIILVGHVWVKGFESLPTFLGLLSAGLAIALKDPVTNVAGWIFIVMQKPFTPGDRIEIGGNTGDVIDIRMFQFTVMEIGNWVDADQSTGRIIHIPNGRIFTETLANYSKGFHYIWNEVAVLVTFESDWKKAKDILRDIANKDSEHLSKSAERKIKEASKKFMIFYTHLTPTIYTRVEDSGVLLTIRYLCEPRHRRDSEGVIWEDILQEFARCTDIDFAYPTQRLYNNRCEGKAGIERPSGNDGIKRSEDGMEPTMV